MIKNRILLLLVVFSCSLFTTIEASKTWSFQNWNKYGKATVGKPTVWDKAWGIPKHGGWLWTWQGGETVKNVLARDPSQQTKDLVLRVEYPYHSRNPEVTPNGGLGFIANPIEITNTVKTVTFQYSVFFPKGFDFVRGGKLPGLYGGHGDCTGGIDQSTCFTTRLMWRDGGIGEIYAYLPHGKQRKNLCDDKVNICNPDYGFSLGRGTYEFKTGEWNTIKQVLTINTPNRLNGEISLYVNGKRAINEKQLMFRTDSSARVGGIMFHTFFGGSDNTWRTPRTQYSYFKGFTLTAE